MYRNKQLEDVVKIVRNISSVVLQLYQQYKLKSRTIPGKNNLELAPFHQKYIYVFFEKGKQLLNS